jgi:two-component system OmpR family sensor kinase
MNRHSVFFKLNLLFLLALAVTLLATGFLLKHLEMKERMELRLKGRLIAQELRRTKRISAETLRALGLRQVSDPERMRRVLERLKRRQRRSAGRHRRFLLRTLRDRGGLLLVLRNGQRTLLFAPRGSWWGRNSVPILIVFAVLMTLSLLYWLLRRSLEPLRLLEREIRSYGEGQTLRKRAAYAEGEDEIARLAGAFYDAVERVERLGRSRRLFIRNILHELNTPVTKGKLLAEISSDPSTKTMLHSIFDRLSLLLEELAQVERFTASEAVPERKPVRIVDLIDQARDRLYLDDPVPYEGENVLIMAEFGSMAVVFKNLIDNGLKYGKNLRLRLRGPSLEFVSEGEPLRHPLEHYLHPFKKESERSEGFGLGLYIVYEILRRLEMRLEYRYEEGHNIFAVTPLDFAA